MCSWLINSIDHCLLNKNLLSKQFFSKWHVLGLGVSGFSFLNMLLRKSGDQLKLLI